MPVSWSEMVEAHRSGVRRAVLDATGALVTEHGLGAVTMSRIAERAGIDRAVLSRHFADLDAIMRAWHDRQLASHLAYLDEVRDDPGDPAERLAAVLRAYAAIIHQVHEQHASQLGCALHGHERLEHTRRQLHQMVRHLIVEGVGTGHFRDDVAPDQLAGHCLHAVAAVAGDPSVAAIRQLVATTMTGLRHP